MFSTLFETDFIVPAPAAAPVYGLISVRPYTDYMTWRYFAKPEHCFSIPFSGQSFSLSAALEHSVLDKQACLKILTSARVRKKPAPG